MSYCTCFAICPSERGLLCPTSTPKGELDRERREYRRSEYRRKLAALNEEYADVRA